MERDAASKRKELTLIVIKELWKRHYNAEDIKINDLAYWACSKFNISRRAAGEIVRTALVSFEETLDKKKIKAENGEEIEKADKVIEELDNRILSDGAIE